MPLLVVVHDTRRNARECAAAFAGFAERHHCAVAAPLFPAADARHPGRDNYKLLAAGPVRFDLALLGIVAEIGRRYPVEAGRFALHGFSGGAQFAHRFFYLHPGRLTAVSVAAPGRITPLDFTRPWWAGVAGCGDLFGRPVRAADLRAVAVQILAGGADTEPVQAGDPDGHPAATGADRLSRARSLHASLAAHDVASRLDVVAGAGHDHEPLLPAAQQFLASALAPGGPLRAGPGPQPG